MSLYDYKISKDISRDDPPFASFIMAAIRKADMDNLAMLKRAFPEIYQEFEKRYHAPEGCLTAQEFVDAQERGWI